MSELDPCEKVDVSGWKIAATRENYEKHIPVWCRYQGFDAHWDGLGLCWGITSHMEDGKPMTPEYCRGCELCAQDRLPPTGDAP